MNDLTILYVTGNKERPDFEEKIKIKLLEVIGNHPLISVSQKPIDFGHNICVGDVGVSYRNAYIQLHIGASNAKTEYIAIAEADQLYPPGYFDFEPKNDIYNYESLWILRHWDKGRFLQKEYGDWTVIVRKSFLIKRLELHLGGSLEWGKSRVGSVFQKRRWERFYVGAPIISVKTRENLSRNTGTIEGSEPEFSLPHWGSAKALSDYLGL